MNEAEEPGIYAILEKLLRATKEPLTCVDLFDAIPNVKQYAANPNRISDYVGHMWRRGLLQRWTAPPQLNNKSRFAYTWKDSTAFEKVAETPRVKSMPDMKVLQTPGVKPQVLITEEDDRIALDFADFTLTIKSKRT